MKKTLAIILALILALVMAAGCGGKVPVEESKEPISKVAEEPSKEGNTDIDQADSTDTGGNIAILDSLLVGTWYGIDSGLHGNAGYFWSFGNDGRFAYLFSGYEPPQGGGSIKSSVRERFMQGKFRENGNTIECYDIRADDFFARGDNWRYFPDRDPALLANTLLATPLIESEIVDDFSLDFEFTDAMILRLVVDRGEFPDQYDMDFEYLLAGEYEAPTTAQDSSGTSDIAGNATGSIVNGEPYSYSGLKMEFENEIENILQRDYHDYAWELLSIFEGMLQFRESLEDINADMRVFHSEQYDFRMSIDEKAVFTDGKTNYRIIMFDGDFLPYATLYIQIYDDVLFETRRIEMLAREGGGWDDLLYCGFIQGFGKNYLVTIVKQYVVYADYIDYRLLSYEIDGNRISNYNALKKEVSQGIWTVTGMNYEFYGGTYIEISYSDTAFWPEDWLNPDYITQESFEDNVFTVALNMDSRYEISLQFDDGYWEVIASHPNLT